MSAGERRLTSGNEFVDDLIEGRIPRQETYGQAADIAKKANVREAVDHHLLMPAETALERITTAVHSLGHYAEAARELLANHESVVERLSASQLQALIELARLADTESQIPERQEPTYRMYSVEPTEPVRLAATLRMLSTRPPVTHTPGFAREGLGNEESLKEWATTNDGDTLAAFVLATLQSNNTNVGGPEKPQGPQGE